MSQRDWFDDDGTPTERAQWLVVRRLLDREDLTPFDLRVIGWAQREHRPIAVNSLDKP